MIRDAHDHNENIGPNDFELERLQAALPEYFDSNGAFMIDRFKEVLSDSDVNLTKEGYGLKFLGKSYAKYLTSTETETVIVPDLVHNQKPENKDSENLYIIGDNLDALKHLLGSYNGQVKCIYIDPPYNTGSDEFVYNDDFGFTPRQLVDKIGLTENEAERVLDLQGKSSHSAWLTFMYPRLQLAKQLLRDDGVIFISIDDNEQSNLKLLCDEVFGEINFINTFVWVSNLKGRQISSFGAAATKEYVLCYSRQSALTPEFTGSISHLKSLMPSAYKGFNYQTKYDERGAYVIKNELYNTNSAFNEVTRPNLVFDIYYNPRTKDVKTAELSDKHLYPDYVKISPKTNNNGENKYHAYRWSAKRVEAESYNLDFIETPNGWKVYTKVRNVDSVVLKDILTDINTTQGTSDVKKIGCESNWFDYPKPVNLIQTFLEATTDKESLILDFFSGSSTTAHAVMKLNAEDGGKRKYVMIQLPEKIMRGKPAYKAGYRTIDQIGRERIQRAAAQITPMIRDEETSATFDCGFRLYRLEEPSEQVLDQLEEFDPEGADALFAGDYVSKFDLDGTPGHDTVLATWLVKDGYGLTTKHTKVKLAEYDLDVCDDSAYIINTGLTSDDVVTLVRMLENGELAVSRVVVFGYSVEFSVMHELKMNLAVLRSGKTVTVIERF